MFFYIRILSLIASQPSNWILHFKGESRIFASIKGICLYVNSSPLYLFADKQFFDIFFCHEGMKYSFYYSLGDFFPSSFLNLNRVNL